jgi:DNA-binding transcriptional regulator YhcF (GntR family)
MENTQKDIPDLLRGNAANRLYRQILYLIATGKWPEGMRLPSIRNAESLFGASRTTVQEAYQILVSDKLVQSKAKSGYTIRRQGANAWISRHRSVLKSLYDEFAETITTTTGLAPLPVLRYMTRLAEIIDHEKPSCAFIECTHLQAEGHTGEINNRLGISILPMTVDNALNMQREWPSHIKLAITTHFHHTELMPLEPQIECEMISIPIEVSPLLRQRINQTKGPIVFLETEQQMAKDIAQDAQKLMSDLPLATVTVDNIEKALADTLVGRSPYQDQATTILLSPRDWGNLNKEWRNHPNVMVVTFSICERAWNTIAEFLGMPIGPLV